MDKNDYKNARPILDIICGVCGNNAFVTGSRIIGGCSPMSDIDIAVMIDTMPILDQKLLQAIGPAILSHYNNGRKYTADKLGLYVNIIPLHPVDFCAWAWTTNTLRESFVCRNLSREVRHRTFELGVLAFKSLYDTGAICHCNPALDWYFNAIPKHIKLRYFMECHDVAIERNTEVK